MSRVRLTRPLCLGVALACAGAYTSLATAPYLDLNADGTTDFLQVVEWITVPPLGGGAISSIVAETSRFPENALTLSAVAPGAPVDDSASWGPSIMATGYFGLRFRNGDHVHYGWLELHNPIVLGSPMLAAGGVIKQLYFNSEPNQPSKVGDVTLRAKAQVNPNAGSVTILFNTDASVAPVTIESRPAVGAGEWTKVATVNLGSAVTLEQSGESRFYRVVQ